MASPSVVLCSAKPTMRNAEKAAEPSPTAAPIASPSPKLCSPIPTATISAIAAGWMAPFPARRPAL